MPKHKAKSGECITSISDEYGFYWKTVWMHAENAALKTKRKDPNMLMEGDVVFVPELALKKEAAATEKLHSFRKKGIPAVLRLQLFDGHEPRADQAFTLTYRGGFHEGTTDAEGYLEAPIPPELFSATLVIGEDEREYDIRLGRLPPIAEVLGVQIRLQNLGYLRKTPSGELDDGTKTAIMTLQFDLGLDMTGDLDESTRSKLVELHDAASDFPEPEEA